MIKINKKFFYLNLGLAMASFAIVNFLLPSKLMAGGTTGLAIILYQLYDIPVSLSFFVLNIPLVLIGGRLLGKEYGYNTIYSIIAITIYTSLITKFLQLDILKSLFESYRWLGAISGGLVLGSGLGLAFCMGGSGGGTSIVAQILERYFNIKIGTTINVVDTIIILLSGLILGGGAALFTIVSLFITGRVINIIKYRGVSINEGNS